MCGISWKGFDMDEMERKALAYACECAGREPHHYARMSDDLPLKASITAHARDIIQNAAFRREVSDAVEAYFGPEGNANLLRLFIIAKPVDPLVQALDDLKDGRAGPTTESYAACLRNAIAARGGKIVWEG
jgi:hypothetical protein